MSTKTLAEAWTEKAIRLYPQIVDVRLTGSRARGDETNSSDWDIVVCIHDDYYDSWHQVKDNLEQRIAFDRALRFKGLDIFFLRPNGKLGQWVFPLGVKYTPTGNEQVDKLRRNGHVIGDWSKFFEELPQAEILFSKG